MRSRATGAALTGLPVALALALALGCGAPDESSAATATSSSSGAGGAGGSVPAPCPAGQIDTEPDGCRPAGIPSQGCAPGFVPNDANGCDAVLPAAPCPAGLMAVPGETVCREVAPCGAGTWDDIPVEPDSEYVDGSYTGNDSDGTALKPWTTVGQGIAAAAPGAIVAIAEGSYLEDLVVSGKSVRLWGVCPARVELVGAGLQVATLSVGPSAPSTEVHDLALTGPAIGIFASGAESLLIDRVWLHDTAGRGINAQQTDGPTSIVLARSLLEAASDVGVLLSGSTVSLEQSVVRGTRPGTGFGRGIGAQNASGSGQRAALHVTSSLLEGNVENGVFVGGSDATIQLSVIRDTASTAAGAFGRGIAAQANPSTGDRAAVTVRGCVLERNHSDGVFVSGSDATIETTVVRDTLATPTEPTSSGLGVSAYPSQSTGQRATLVVRTSVLERSAQLGALASGSDLTLEGTVVRDSALGAGVALQIEPSASSKATGTLRGCVLEGNSEFGLFATGADATIDGTLVRNTVPNAAGGYGRGIQIQASVETGVRSSAELQHTRIESCREFGLALVGSDLQADDLEIADITPSQADGRFGDAVAAVAEIAAAQAELTGSRFERASRVAVSNFGATLLLGSSVFECNTIDLDGETFLAEPATFEDLGGNVCGCSGSASECAVRSTNLEPPSAEP